MTSRDDILRDIRTALRRSGHAHRHTTENIPREYQRTGDFPAGSETLISQVTDALEDYGATIVRARGDAEVAEQITAMLEGHPSVVIPVGAPENWIRVAMKRHRVYLDSTDQPLSHRTLDTISAALTGSRLAISSTGTIVLDSAPDQGRRAISLIPDTHVVIVETASVVQTVPEAFAVLDAHPTRPITWIAGPSATSDIELSRVEGVHGPRTLKVILSSQGE